MDSDLIPHETLAEFVARKTQSDDLFEKPRSEFEWQLLWLWNELRAAGEFHCSRHLDLGQRLENAQKLWDLGKRYCWADLETSFAVFVGVCAFVGLQVIDPKAEQPTELSAFSFQLSALP